MMTSFRVTFFVLGWRENDICCVEDVEEDDTKIEESGMVLLVDPLSYQYLVGAEIDYSENLLGSRFVVTNPNASNTCGCGNSFSI